MESNNTANAKQNDIAVRDIFIKTVRIIADIKHKWKLLLICALIGAVLGLSYSVLIPPKYTAVSTFVLDESDKEGMLGQYAGLAAIAGIDINGGAGGIFKGDNIIELYKSRAMIKKTLLTAADFPQGKQKLIDRYVASHQLRQKWESDSDVGTVNFNTDPDHFNRKQDSLITDIAVRFDKKFLEVGKPDKKLAIIKVAFTDKDELFAKAFTERLVDNVNNFYVQTKTKKTSQNVLVLQHQADSVKRALNQSLSGAASALDAAPNANPALLSLRVPSQKKQVDVQAGTAIYSEMIKNLEIAKISLRQQTPLIQFVDQPVLPLEKSHVGKVKGIVIGAFAGMFLIICYLLGTRLLRSVANSTM